MEVLDEEWNNILRVHALQGVLFTRFVVMRNLLLVSGDQGIGQCDRPRALDALALLLGAVGATALVEFHGVNKVVNFTNLGDCTANGLSSGTLWYRANEEADGEWIAIKSISKGGSIRAPERQWGA